MKARKFCDWPIYNRGEVIHIEVLSYHDATILCRQFQKQKPLHRVDWYFASGRAVFKALRKSRARLIWEILTKKPLG